MEYNDAIEKSLKNIERILEFIKRAKLIIAIDSISR
jgi:hypothetical protein